MVLGGRSAGSRDARMRELIEEHIAEASTKTRVYRGRGSAAAGARRRGAAGCRGRKLCASADEASAAIVPGSTAPITPVKVKTVTVRLLASKSVAPLAAARQPSRFEPRASLSSSPSGRKHWSQARGAAPVAAAAPSRASASADRPRIPGLGQLAAVAAAKRRQSVGKAAPAIARQGRRGTDRQRALPPRRRPRRLGDPGRRLRGRGRSQAASEPAKSKMASVLDKAEAYIERTVKGAKTYYRARFAGFDRDQAKPPASGSSAKTSPAWR